MNPSGSQSQTSGPAYERPELALSPFDQAAAGGENGVSIDASNLAKGYVAVSATASTRLKFQISFEGSETQYYFDLPSDGTPISCPLVQGSGAYTFTVWENTTGQRYSELYSLADQPVTLADEFQPFIRPSVYCDYDASSKSTQLANDLSADAQNEGDVVRGIYDWIVENIAYDEDKAARLADATGYLPNPDSCIADGSGICFDYASLAAAMLRSQGIPCKIITGYVSPDNIYHAWNMVYIDGTWVDAHIDIKQNTWTRIDTTFAAGSGSSYVGDGIAYTDLYTY
ncbi:transglutaminase-like domain-containing protein [Eggerthella lenta]|uniref:transglutaminase-like domain-containing protein n=1 Tax=Eggerthella lenta TaxID=84112 RepID=UPI001F183347|nr:transglutaminase-like domain-containing protein [Eggerthella lenta]